MPRRVLLEFLCVAAILGTIGGVIYAERVTVEAEVEVTVWKHATTDAIYLSTRPVDGTWTTHNTPVDFGELAEGSAFYQGSAIAVQVPVTVEVPDTVSAIESVTISDPNDHQPNEISRVDFVPTPGGLQVTISTSRSFSFQEKQYWQSYILVNLQFDPVSDQDQVSLITNYDLAVRVEGDMAFFHDDTYQRVGAVDVTFRRDDQLTFTIPLSRFGDAQTLAIATVGAWAHSLDACFSSDISTCYRYDYAPDRGKTAPVVKIR